MKKYFLLCLLFFTVLWSQSQKVIAIDMFPQNLEAFFELRDELAQSPEGGLAVFILALHAYTQEEDWGEAAVIASLDRSELVEARKEGYKGYTWNRAGAGYHLDRFMERPYLPASYFLGTDAESHYKLGESLELSMSTNKYSQLAEDKIKVYVECSGASSARPASLIKNNRGLWKVDEFSSLSVGIVKPIEPIDDDL